MNSKTNKLTALFICILLTSFSAGCFKQETASLNEEQIEQQVTIAQQYLDEGQIESAFGILEDLVEAFPENPSVIEGLAFAYASENENVVAATYFEKLYEIDPSRSEVCLYAAQTYVEQENWDAAAYNYENYLQDFPEDASTWKALSDVHLQQNQPRFALQALLKATEVADSALDLSEQTHIGHLFLQLGGTKQAQERFEFVLEQNEEHPQALLGLLQIELQTNDLESAETILNRLDAVSPEALDNSPLAPTREVIARWHEEQEIKQKQLEEEQRKAAEAEQAQAPAISIATTSPEEEAQIAEDAATLADADTPKAELPNKKIGRIIPNAPLKNVSESYGVRITNNGPVLTPQNPKPMSTPQVAQGTESKGPKITVGGTKAPEETAKPKVAAKPKTKTAEEWLHTAHAYHNKKDFKKAMQSYWKALELKPSDAQSWHKLSLASIEAGDLPQAEMTALEAIRRKPDHLPYTLAYLKAVQRARSGDQLMAELVKAKQKFPESAEISLALARGYDQIEGNNYNARMAYLEFLESFPSHPRSGEVRTALRRLR